VTGISYDRSVVYYEKWGKLRLETGIWEGALYNVKAEEVPLKLEFFNNVKDDNVTLISPYFRVINNSSSDEFICSM